MRVIARLRDEEGVESLYLDYAENTLGTSLRIGRQIGIRKHDATKSDHIGFVGGVHVDLIRNFEVGYVARTLGVARPVRHRCHRAERLARFNRKQVLKQDDWMDQVPGKHRFVLDTTSPAAADIVRGTGKLKAEVETSLWELVAAGVVTASAAR